MKNVMIILVAIIFAIVIFTNCGGSKSKSDKKVADSTKSEVKGNKLKSDSKEAIKTISEKYYIPVNESKSDLIFTINQNLNFELVNYKESFEGKYVDGKVQFDDKNSTIIDFLLKGKNIVLKNQNDVEVEFREATDNDLLAGTWSYRTSNGLRGEYCMKFDNKGNWIEYEFGLKGQYKNNGNRKFSIHNCNLEGENVKTANVNIKNVNNILITWTTSYGNNPMDLSQTRPKKAQLQSLNQIFN